MINTGRLAGLKHILLSLILHVAVLAMLLFVQPVSLPRAVQDAPVEVEIIAAAPSGKPVVTPSAQTALPSARAALTSDKIISAARRSLPKPKQEAVDPDTMIAARTLYSATMLADPRSAKARLAMRELSPDERIIQLCDIEAMEQVHRWKGQFAPDSVVAYATESARFSQHGVNAEGAAFHSHGRWFSMRFKCDVSTDGAAVQAFAFKVGEPIPRTAWESYNLASDMGADD